jgi:hypothetical protein
VDPIFHVSLHRGEVLLGSEDDVVVSLSPVFTSNLAGLLALFPTRYLAAPSG